MSEGANNIIWNIILNVFTKYHKTRGWKYKKTGYYPFWYNLFSYRCFETIKVVKVQVCLKLDDIGTVDTEAFSPNHSSDFLWDTWYLKDLLFLLFIL